MLLAIKIEQERTKEKILELHINVVFFGKRAYGAEAAALTYYDRPLSELKPRAARDAGRYQAAGLRQSDQRPGLGAEPPQPGARAHAGAGVDRPAGVREGPRRPDHRASAPSGTGAVGAVRGGVGAANSSRATGPTSTTPGTRCTRPSTPGCRRTPTRALRNGLTGYDRRRGYRGPEGRVEDAADLDALVALASDPVARGRAGRVRDVTPGAIF